MTRNSVDFPFLRFNLAIEMLVISGIDMDGIRPVLVFSFNLAIEMLVISGRCRGCCARGLNLVSISQSRCLSFQGKRRNLPAGMLSVSISQSRCLSFQVKIFVGTLRNSEVSISQSRCLSFQDGEGVDIQGLPFLVSISQSRCLSFQEGAQRVHELP